MAVRPRAAWFLYFFFVSASSSFSLSGLLRPSSQVARAALGLPRYDGLGRVHGVAEALIDPQLLGFSNFGFLFCAPLFAVILR